eukprot:6214231-Pleurochrysis_carterae.AAC.2
MESSRVANMYVGEPEGPSSSVRSEPYARNEGLMATLTVSSGGHSSRGSNRAMLVVTQRTVPATAGDIINGLSDSGSAPAPKSSPSAMIACEKVTVSACEHGSAGRWLEYFYTKQKT